MIGKQNEIGSQPVSLYIHIPFCTKKCSYCHFYVLPDKDPFKEQLLVGLKLEWEQIKDKLKGKEIVSIYFGGGTPSLLGPQGIETILHLFPPNKAQEITLEANPENVSLELMRGMKDIGINRVSLGVQTLDNALLKSLGREHTSQKALEAIELTYTAGIENISIDLMYELPRQTVASWEKTLLQLQGLPISHLSLYNLTFEQHTLFYKKQKELTPLLPSPENSLAMLQHATTFLPQMGLNRYEISAFSKPERTSCHNTGYWTARPFLGLGPSAFSYWDKTRYQNLADLQAYARALHEGNPPLGFKETLSPQHHLNELLAVELRLLKGVDLLFFESRNGKLPSSTRASLQEAADHGWLKLSETHAQLTEQGLLFYDSVASLII